MGAGRDLRPPTGKTKAVETRSLTPMERSVVLGVAAGRTSAEVAAQLGIDATTVEWHVSRACRKLGVRSRDGLAALLAGDIAEQLGEAVE